MLIARCLATSRLFAGQTSTHKPQPVQSSGATWTVIFQPGYSFPLQSVATKPAGAPSRASGG